MERCRGPPSMVRSFHMAHSLGRGLHAERLRRGEEGGYILAARDFLADARSEPFREYLNISPSTPERYNACDQIHWDEPERAMHAILAAASTGDSDVRAKL